MTTRRTRAPKPSIEAVTTRRTVRHPETPEHLEPLLGHTREEAEEAVRQAGGEPRVTNVDGVPAIVTRDYRTDRVNLHMEGGKVVAAYFG